MKPLAARLLPLLLAVAACAATSRDATLTRVMAGLDAAREVVHEADVARQAAIPGEHATRPEAEAALATHRAARDKVTASFRAAYIAVAVASINLTEDALARVLHTAAAAIKAARETGLLR